MSVDNAYLYDYFANADSCKFIPQNHCPHIGYMELSYTAR